MDANLKQKLTRPSIWLRLVSMIVLAIAFNIAEIVLYAVVIFQFLSALFTRKPNSHFTRFGRNLARYIQQIVAFLTFASEDRPFPFSSWPDEPHDKPLAIQNDNQSDGDTEQSKAETETSEAVKPKRSAARKPATARKPRTPAKKDT